MPQEQNTQSTETKPEDKAPETKPDKITVDIDGVSLEVDLETGKKLIEKRTQAKKDVSELTKKVQDAEAKAKDATSKAALLEAMRASDVEAVTQQISQQYLDKIASYEKKIFDAELSSELATLGIVPAAIPDAVKLVKSDVKVELKDGEVMIADKKAKDYLGEWIKSKQHLVVVSQKPGSKPEMNGRGAKITTQKSAGDMSKGMAKLLGQ